MAKAKTKCLVHIRRDHSRIAICGKLYALGHLMVSSIEYPGVDVTKINLCDRCAFLLDCETPRKK